MNAVRFAVGILFVVLASKTSAPAMAQDVGQPSDASVRHADPPQHRALLSAAEGENADCALPDDGLDGCYRPSPCPTVYGQVEALFMQRGPRFTRQPIVVDPNTSVTFLSTSDLDFNFDPGLRATVGKRLCEGRALEFSYFGLFPGNASADAVKPDLNAFLAFPDNLFGNVFVDIDRAQVNYSSWMHSFEVNLPRCCGCCDECRDECGDECGGECGAECGGECGGGEMRCRSVEWLAGFRYLHLGEELDISAQRTVDGLVEDGAYNIRTANNLFGAQLGARLRRSWGRFGWEAAGKAGIFGNDAHQRQSVVDFPSFPLRPTVSSSGGTVAFVGEINLSALYRLTDVWNLRAGYNVLWIEGLALAPDQLDFNFAASPSGNQLADGGGMFLHGVNVGLEARW
ncbi:MAG: BBP7 family outer membrane beta-barrel protein [Pirellulales bacterium]